MKTEIQPILRWVGSKRAQAVGLAKELAGALAILGGRYFEPFLGSASVALAMREAGIPAESMRLGDGLDTLIETYKALCAYPKETIEAFYALLEKAEKARSRHLYNKLRADVNQERRQAAFLSTPRPELAAEFLYLNVRGFNGLVRENKSGDFNMTIGRSGYKKGELRAPKRGEILEFAQSLIGAELFAGDFELLINQAGAGDLIYADPPYDGTFNSYSKEWKPSDQERLAQALQRANKRGAMIYASNTDTERVRALYAWCNVKEREIAWQVGGKKERRVDAKEVLLVAPPAKVTSEALECGSSQRPPL
jgi:DNA adenine methylase